MSEKISSSTQDISREGLTTEKLSHFLRVLFHTEATQVLAGYNKFLDINFEDLWRYGKRGIILDIDECVAPHHGNIFPENAKRIQLLIQDGWKIVVFSNMKKSDRYEELENSGVKVITSRFAKPDVRGFLESVSELGLEKDEVLMIGDNFLTDGGAIRAGIDFIKIKPIETSDKSKKFSRVVQLKVRSLVDEIAQMRGNLRYQ